MVRQLLLEMLVSPVLSPVEGSPSGLTHIRIKELVQAIYRMLVTF
jgi:hypothetical protein